jgi:hypothetical protein
MRTSNRDHLGASSSNHAEQPEYEGDHHDASQRNGKIHIGLLRPCWLDFGVGLAERGQRRVEGPPLGPDQFRTRFLCRSRLTHTTLGMKQKPAPGPFIRLCGEPKRRSKVIRIVRMQPRRSQSRLCREETAANYTGWYARYDRTQECYAPPRSHGSST